MLNLTNISVGNILRNLDLNVECGQCVLLIGENGAGKTTLFNTISGIIYPDSGSVALDERDITAVPHHKRARWISSVLQDPRFGTVGELTILENLKLSSMRNSRKFLNSQVQIEFFKEKLSALGMNLETRLSDKVGTLSGGQRQALSLVMSTISDCKLLLLDEITAALDPSNSKLVMNLVNDIIYQEKKTCLMITHDLHFINSFVGPIMKLEDGRIHKTI